MFGSRNKQSNLHGSGAWSSITLSLTLSVAAAMATVVSMSAEQLTELIQRVGGGAQQGRGGVGGEGGRGDEGEFEKFVGKQLDAKGFDGVGDFKGGEEGWGVWAWRMKVAVGAMHGDLASILVEAEGHEGKTVKELRADFADMGGSNGSRVDKASQELYSVLVRFYDLGSCNDCEIHYELRWRRSMGKTSRQLQQTHHGTHVPSAAGLPLPACSERP